MAPAGTLRARLPPLRMLAWWVAGTTLVLAVGGLLFAWSGLYNVSASAGHFALTRAFIEFGLESSVRTQSLGIDPPPLDGDDLVRLGAGHFAGGCMPCHSAPGRPTSPITESMLPAPPRLSEAIGRWDTRELFWIVKNGLKYTGMPAWAAPQRDDEVWAIVAFLRRLPGLSAGEYSELANFAAARGTTAEPERRAVFSEALLGCARCHGDEDSPPTSRLVPKLYGQSERYMETALRDYASGARFSGVMQPVAAELDATAIKDLSADYARLTDGAVDTGPATASPELVDNGRRLATAGVPSEGIPPCLSCHGAGRSEIFPRLQGQHAPYIVGQLRLLKSGRRGRSVTNAIMEAIARRLTDRQMQEAAAYFESLGSDRPGAQAADGAPEGGSP